MVIGSQKTDLTVKNGIFCEHLADKGLRKVGIEFQSRKNF